MAANSQSTLTSQNIQRIIDNTDWNLYHQRVGHGVSYPNCSFYDGGIICPAWRGWVLSGRLLYSSDEEYIKNIRNYHPNISELDLVGILKQKDAELATQS